jgi:hypothetical protein
MEGATAQVFGDNNLLQKTDTNNDIKTGQIF